MLDLTKVLQEKRTRGKKALVAYVTAGLGHDWLDSLAAVVDGGADIVEVGVPFSDPMIDGPVIQRASQIALEAGTTPLDVFSALRSRDFGVPLVAMTYYNLIHHAGVSRFAGWMGEANVSGAIFPDMPYEESGEWREAAGKVQISTIQLVAPSTPDDRARMLCELSEGFIYGVGVMGVTGERSELPQSALHIAKRLKTFTDKTVLVGIGVSTADQAVAVSAISDGVIVGSALVRRLIEGAGPKGAYDFILSLREAMDAH